MDFGALLVSMFGAASLLFSFIEYGIARKKRITIDRIREKSAK